MFGSVVEGWVNQVDFGLEVKQKYDEFTKPSDAYEYIQTLVMKQESNKSVAGGKSSSSDAHCPLVSFRLENQNRNGNYFVQSYIIHVDVGLAWAEFKRSVTLTSSCDKYATGAFFFSLQGF